MLTDVSTHPRKKHASKNLIAAGIILLILGTATLVAMLSNQSTWTKSSKRMAALQRRVRNVENDADDLPIIPSQNLQQYELQVAQDGDKKCRRRRNKKLKGYPTIDFEEFVYVVRGATRDSPAKFIEKRSASNNWKNCGQTEVSSFRARCVLDVNNKRMYIMFRGLSLAQLAICGLSGPAITASCFAYFEIAANDPGTKQKFKKWIKKKLKKNSDYELFGITGSSYGAFFATRLAKKYKVWRITFNGYKARTGPYTINLRKPGSDLAVNLSTKCRYYTVAGVGGHSTKYWMRKKVRNKDWTNFLPSGKSAIDLP